MNVAEQVLHVFEVVTPDFMFGGKKIFYDVAEAFDTDAKSMKGDLRAIAKCAVVKVAGFGEALERQVLEQSIAGAEVGGAGGKRLAPLAPLFLVEIGESGLGFVLLFAFAGFEDFEESLG